MKKYTVLYLLIITISACNRQGVDLGKDVTIPVTVEQLKPQSIEKYIEITGVVEPVMDVQLKAGISGNYVLKINPATGRKYALGDRVTEGSDIIVLEDKEFENSLKLNSLKLNLEITKQVFDKQQSLYDKGGVTLSELKNAEINYINANYSYEDALINLQKMQVKAPFSGTIIDLPYYTPGVKIEANALLVKLMDYSKLHFEVNLAEKTMGEVKTGQQVRITNYIIPEDTLTGSITELSPAIDEETRSYKGYITISNPGLHLRPGMYVKGEIIVARAENVIVVSKDIIVSKQRGNSVFIVDKGIAYEKNVEFGLENPTRVQIISGLNLNDQIVVKGFETLRDRSKVKELK